VSRWWRCGEIVSVGGDEPSSELGERGCEDGGTSSGSRHVAREGDMFDCGEDSDMAVDIHGIVEGRYVGGGDETCFVLGVLCIIRDVISLIERIDQASKTIPVRIEIASKWPK
jgi:hypothetical protein